MNFSPQIFNPVFFYRMEVKQPWIKAPCLAGNFPYTPVMREVILHGDVDASTNYYHERSSLCNGNTYIDVKTIMAMYICMLCRSDAVAVSMCLYEQQHWFEIVPTDAYKFNAEQVILKHLP
jgi:hypothetical protein